MVAAVPAERCVLVCCLRWCSLSAALSYSVVAALWDHRSEITCWCTREVAGFVVCSHHDEGFVPAGVLFNPFDDSLDCLVEVFDLFDVALGLVCVAGPVDSAAFNHEEEALVVVIEDVECTLGHGAQIDNVVLCCTRCAALLEGVSNLSDAEHTGWGPALGELAEAFVVLDERVVGMSACELLVFFCADVLVLRRSELLVVVVEEWVACTHNDIHVTLDLFLGDAVVVLAGLVVRGIRSWGGVGERNAGNHACGLAEGLSALTEVLYDLLVRVNADTCVVGLDAGSHCGTCRSRVSWLVLDPVEVSPCFCGVVDRAVYPVGRHTGVIPGLPAFLRLGVAAVWHDLLVWALLYLPVHLVLGEGVVVIDVAVAHAVTNEDDDVLWAVDLWLSVSWNSGGEGCECEASCGRCDHRGANCFHCGNPFLLA